MHRTLKETKLIQNLSWNSWYNSKCKLRYWNGIENRWRV